MYWNITDEKRLITSLGFAVKSGYLDKILGELLTKGELDLAVLRLKAMCMLYDGVTYKTIQKATDLSPTTISRLSKYVSNNKSSFRKVINEFEKYGPSYSE